MERNNIIEDISVWNYARGNTEYDKGHEYRMLEEELEEFLASTTVENSAKELADIIFVAIGGLYKLVDNKADKAQAVMQAVIEANFAKGNKKVNGKVQKGKVYVNPEPIIYSILFDRQTTWDTYLKDNDHIYEGV